MIIIIIILWKQLRRRRQAREWTWNFWQFSNFWKPSPLSRIAIHGTK